MNYNELVRLTRDLPCFDMALLVQAFDEQRAVIRTQIARLAKQGKVVRLRRGMYTLSDEYRHAILTPAALANMLYRPSYLSGPWVLGFYDMIPERVVWLTSVTSRVPRHFENRYGSFDYRSIKRDFFFGYRTTRYGQQEILAAEPEKALLDHWYLTPGEWTEDRIREMRYQNADKVSPDKLLEWADRYQRPRLLRAVKRWLAVAGEEEKGTVTL